MVNIYPGLCNKKDWPACGTGTLLAQAVPANYATERPWAAVAHEVHSCHVKSLNTYEDDDERENRYE